ncbi:molybdopterin oxidoreductase family protein [Yinghuangia aomiensis]
MFERMAEGRIKACWIICTNPVASVANRKTVIAGLEAAEFVLTQDVFADTETNGYADVVLPGALWTETEGVLINSERSLTLAQPGIDPPGEATADWRIIARIAQAMGYTEAFAYTSAEEVFEEIKRAYNPKTGWDLRGITYGRLRETPVQWPAAPGGPARNLIRYLDEGGRPAFPTATGRAVFFARPHVPAKEMPDDDYPFVLNTGRLPHQWHTLTKTGRVGKLNRLDPALFIEIHPDDARALGLADGDPVEIASRRGKAVLPAVVTERVRPGCCFAPFHWNDLYGEYLQRQRGHQRRRRPAFVPAEFKVCAVTLAKSAVPVAVAPPGQGTPEPHPLPLLEPVPAGGPRGGTGTALAGLLGIRRRRPRSSTPTNAATWPGSSPVSTPARPACRCCPPRRRCGPNMRSGSTGCWPGGSPGRPPRRRPGPSTRWTTHRRRSPRWWCCGPRRRATPRSSPSLPRNG